MRRDSDFDPATLEDAWRECRTENPRQNNPDGFAVFRAGFRRGVAQGALLCATTSFHAGPDDEEKS